MGNSISITPMAGLPEIRPGDDLSSLIIQAIRKNCGKLEEGDVCVIAQKIVSKAEGRLVSLNTVEPSSKALEFAEAFDKDARLVEVVLSESKRIVRMERGIIISETWHGFVCANAGVDSSNADAGLVVLLPSDPDASARRVRDSLKNEFDTEVAVVISDTFGRPWREGLVNVAIGVAGLAPLIDYRGQPDSKGHTLRVTIIAVADELASAAELMMKKTDGVPAVIIRGFEYERREASNQEMIRRGELDLFR